MINFTGFTVAGAWTTYAQGGQLILTIFGTDADGNDREFIVDIGGPSQTPGHCSVNEIDLHTGLVINA